MVSRPPTSSTSSPRFLKGCPESPEHSPGHRFQMVLLCSRHNHPVSGGVDGLRAHAGASVIQPKRAL